jgi:ABC-type nitrate/sulfonate/bicarbonate transport system substrate-binding protein
MIGINPEGAYAQGLVAHKDSNILTPTDLKGKRVGLVQGATAQFGFLMMMRQHGIRAEQVTVVNMAPETQLRALEARQIDAAMVWEPWMQRMIRNGNARIIETEGNLGIYTNVDCYSVRRDWLSRHGETALRFLRALVTANDAVQQESQGRLSSGDPRFRAQQCGGRGDL